MSAAESSSRMRGARTYASYGSGRPTLGLDPARAGTGRPHRGRPKVVKPVRSRLGRRSRRVRLDSACSRAAPSRSVETVHVLGAEEVGQTGDAKLFGELLVQGDHDQLRTDGC